MPGAFGQRIMPRVRYPVCSKNKFRHAMFMDREF